MKKIALLLMPMLFLLTACFSDQNSDARAVHVPPQQKVADSDKSARTTPAPSAQSTENTGTMGTSPTEFCKSHLIKMGDNVEWSENGGKSGFDFWTDGSKHLKDFINCGWDMNAPNAKGEYPAIQALRVYVKSPDELRTFMSYNPALDVKDSHGHDLYSIALALQTVPSDILDRLKSRLSPEQQQFDQEVVQLTRHGSTLSIDDLVRLMKNGIDLNEDMTVYDSEAAFDQYGNITDPDFGTGTILGSAVLHQDVSKVKWLLEHGSDANQSFGRGEFRQSPLARALRGNLPIAELLLQHGANPNEKILLYPGEATLSSYYVCDPKISKLLQKYGGTEWFYKDVVNNKMTNLSKEEVLNSCKSKPDSTSVKP